MKKKKKRARLVRGQSSVELNAISLFNSKLSYDFVAELPVVF